MRQKRIWGSNPHLSARDFYRSVYFGPVFVLKCIRFALQGESDAGFETEKRAYGARRLPDFAPSDAYADGAGKTRFGVEIDGYPAKTSSAMRKMHRSRRVRHRFPSSRIRDRDDPAGYPQIILVKAVYRHAVRSKIRSV